MGHKIIPREYPGVKRVTLKEAVSDGLDRYFTGAKCCRGHVAPRRVDNSRCVVCRAEDFQFNSEKYLGRLRELRAANPVAALIHNSKGRAKRAGIKYSITAADIKMTANCPCCSVEMHSRNSGPAKCGAIDQSPSLDRIIPSLGYIPGNVAVICFRCNTIKGNATVAEMKQVLSWMESLEKAPPKLSLVG